MASPRSDESSVSPYDIQGLVNTSYFSGSSNSTLSNAQRALRQNPSEWLHSSPHHQNATSNVARYMANMPHLPRPVVHSPFEQSQWSGRTFNRTQTQARQAASSFEQSYASAGPVVPQSSPSQAKPPVKKRKMSEKPESKQKEINLSDSEDAFHLSRSERKRRREMKRRSDVNRGFDDLTTLLNKRKPPEFCSAGEGEKGNGDSSCVSSFNRVDLIAKTVCVMERLFKENDEMKERLKQLEHVVEEGNAQIELLMMFPIMVPADQPTRVGEAVPPNAIPLPPIIPSAYLNGSPRPTIYHPPRAMYGHSFLSGIGRPTDLTASTVRWMQVPENSEASHLNAATSIDKKSAPKKG